MGKGKKVLKPEGIEVTPEGSEVMPEGSDVTPLGSNAVLTELIVTDTVPVGPIGAVLVLIGSKELPVPVAVVEVEEFAYGAPLVLLGAGNPVLEAPGLVPMGPDAVELLMPVGKRRL